MMQAVASDLISPKTMREMVKMRKACAWAVATRAVIFAVSA